MKKLLLSLMLAVSSLTFAVTEIKTISLDEAQKIANGALAEARAQKVSSTIVIFNKVGDAIVTLKDDGTALHTEATAGKKAFTALTLGAPTSVVSDILKNVPQLKEIDKIVSLPGGFPIVINGELVGSIGVAGAMSADIDAKIAVKGLEALKK